MKEATKNLANMDTESYIDNYLDGLLSEQDSDEFETRCLEDKNFFCQVAERERLREQVAHVIKKNGEEIFAAYAEQPARRKAEKPVETVIGKIVGWWTNVKPIWKFAIVPVAAAIVLIMLVLPGTEESFHKNSELENELGSKIYRSEKLEILSPRRGEVFRDSVAFLWQTNSKGPFELQILNNKAEVIYINLSNEKAFTVADSLAAGLYYWKLYAQEYLVYVGKFYIKQKSK